MTSQSGVSNTPRYNLLVHSNHDDDVDIQRRLEAERDSKEKREGYAPYPDTRISRAPPPSAQMYRRTNSGDSSEGGGPYGRDPRDRGDPRGDPRGPPPPSDPRDRGGGGDPRDRGGPGDVRRGPPPRNYSGEGNPGPGGRNSPVYNDYPPPPERGGYRGGPGPGRGPPPPRNGGPPDDYPERGGPRGPPPPRNSGPPDDYPPERGGYRPSNSPPPPSGEGGPRRPPPPQNSGRSSITSETLSMAEQDFLAKYGYSGGGGGRNPNDNSMSSLPGAQSIPGGGQSVTSHDTGFSSISRPRMGRLGLGGMGGGPGPGGPGGDPRDRYVGGGQSVTSHMTESVISNPRMSRMMDEDDDPTHHTRGRGGPPRARSPVRYSPPDRDPPRRNLYERVQNYSRDNGPRSVGGGYPGDRGPPGNFPPSRPQSRGPPPNSYYDDGPPPYPDDPRGPPPGPPRGMDDSTPRRHMLQRMPSQSTISTSGFRSFYSDAYTIRGDQSTIQSDYRHHYDGPPPPPPRDDYGHSSPPMYGGASVGGRSMRSYGGSTWDTRGSIGSRSAGGGGGYYPPPPRRGPPPPPPPRDYSPRGGPGPGPRGPPPPHHHQQTPDRPLLEVAPGLLMHLMGTDETMKAIQRGQITVTSCVVCGMDVHCHSASEYVLCPDCRVVSPVNQLDNAVDMTPQQGGLVGLGVKTEMLITMMEAGAGQY